MSPYEGINKDMWKEKTEELIKNHPLNTEDIVNSVLTAWER